MTAAKIETIRGLNLSGSENMGKKLSRPVIPILAASAIGLAAVIGGGALALAGNADEDLSDNETCLDCHVDQEFQGLVKIEGPQVHNPADGSLNVEAHTEFACIDCHMDVEEIPHAEDVERTVDCLGCHSEVPGE